MAGNKPFDAKGKSASFEQALTLFAQEHFLVKAIMVELHQKHCCVTSVALSSCLPLHVHPFLLLMTVGAFIASPIHYLTTV